MSIVLIDASVDSLTVSWPDRDTNKNEANSKATSSSSSTYCLQYRRHCSSNTTTTNTTTAVYPYETLSNSLHTTLVRKKNLMDPNQYGFIFRVRIVNSSTNVEMEKNNNNNNNDDDDDVYHDWITHTEPFHLLTKEEDSQRIKEPPFVTYGGTNASLRISWHTTTTTTTDPQQQQQQQTTTTDPTTTATTYEIQMRENRGGIPWTTIATQYKSTEVRKKNLISIYGYQFRIRSTSMKMVSFFSPPSKPMIPLSYYSTTCTGLQRLFASLTKQTLLSNFDRMTNKNKNTATTTVVVPVADILGGKEFILLYVSAHWCGPCRQYTPKLVRWYQQQQQMIKSEKNESPIEIVFLSADHDETSFQSYFNNMPWTAIDYNDPTREQLQSYLRVSGIPRLAILNGRTGTIIEDNAVNKSLDIQRWRNLVSK